MADPSASIIHDGARTLDVWDRSVLDLGVPYPADMAALPTSTPNPGNLRRKSRRSWFETTPKGMKLEIAVEANVVKPVKCLTGDVETLTLTHFTAPPRLGFGNMKPGQVKVSTLLLRNPHDYEQSVRVEKVPEKKHFTVSCKEFSVGGGETYRLEVTWTPTEAGAFREMILMQVDQSYRLQAYVFGTVVAPPQKKKQRKVGLLASKVSRPFSVIHTTSLANINQQYSPEKKAGIQFKDIKTQAQSNVGKPVTQSRGMETVMQSTTNRKRKSGESRKSGRLSGKFEIDIKVDKKTSQNNDENVEPRNFTQFQQPLSKADSQSDRIKLVQKQKMEVKVPRKKMRRSNTYCNNSGLGLVVPIIHGETVQGLKDTSLINIDDCDISGIQPLEVSTGKSDDVRMLNNVGSMPSFIETGQEFSENDNKNKLEPSFLEMEDILTIVSVNKLENVRNGDLVEPSFIDVVDTFTVNGKREPYNCHERDTEEPSFLEHSADLETGSKISSCLPNRLLAVAKRDESFHDSLEGTPCRTKENQLVELPSFLAQENIPEGDAPIRKLRRSSRKRSEIFDLDIEGSPTPVKLLRSAKRRSARVVVSPESFVRDMSSAKKGMIRDQFNDKDDIGSVASPYKPLNDSVGQSSILEQLKNIKSFIHEKSFEIQKSADDSFSRDGDSFSREKMDSVKELDRRETFVKRRTPPRFSMAGKDVNIRRGTFVTDATKMKLLETQKPSEASPRRTTFTVIKNSNNENLKSPMRSRSEGCPRVIQAGISSKNFLDENVESTSVNDSQTIECEIEEPVIEKTEVSVNARVLSGNVTKDRNPDILNRVSDTNNSKRLFSEDSLENDSFEKQFGSPKAIPAEPNDEYNRRATLTVTKTRPSDALLEHAQRKCVAASLFGSSPNYSDKNHKIAPISESNNTVDCDERDEEKVADPSPKSSQNSTFEVSTSYNATGVFEASFPSTPHQLPVSPNPDNSRRSTQVVEQPKVLNLSRVDRKQLFLPGDKVDELYEDQSNFIDETDSKSNKTSLKKGSFDEKIEHEENETNHSEVEMNTFENIEAESDSPSMNTRRRKLSARRSLSSLKQLSEVEIDSTDNEKENLADVELVEAEKQSAEQLFFIPFDDKLLEDVPLVKQTSRKDPRQFMKKRSNPLTQAEDMRAKRIKSDSTDVTSKGKQTIKSKQNLPTRTTRQLLRNKGSVNESQTRPVVKPKANVMKGLAQSKLILLKKSKTALPKHPLPFAAKNMYYDERWMEKQERGFVNWLNFILTPSEEYQSSEVKVKVDAGKLSVDVAKGSVKLAPTNEVLSLRAYSAHRKLNRLRKSACRLFQSDSVIRVIQKIESEVESGRLAVRKDKMLHADLGIKQRILDLLLSFNPLWLRIGMETIYGEVVPLQSNNDVWGLSRFIVTRLLTSPDIAQEFAHPTVPHLYREGYAEATAQHTLKKFLMLVYFLDRAKEQRLIDHNPCLLCKDSDFKTSKDLLLQFSRDCLAGEGDITRHLSYLGYKVIYAQTALDEFDFAVSKLSTDLRDGLRLTRILEFLCNKPELSRTLRVPAISRLQKVHNVEVVFKILAQQGLDTGKVTPRDVVDGHREKTLQLLWTIILHYQVELLLNEAQLREEIEILQRSLRVKNQLTNLLNYEQNLKSRRESREPDLHTQNKRLNLLLKWCRSVCAFYNIKIENFTVSFSDGRALCHILHHYHPSLLPRDKIMAETTMTHMEDLECDGHRNMASSFNDSCNSSAVFGDLEDPEVFQQLLNNEKENFRLLFEKVKLLGGVPLMLKWTDMSNTIPDEKVVVTYLLYLCARLLDIRHESRAARVIQLAWRKYRLKTMQGELKLKHQAASVIQRAAREFLKHQRIKRHLAAAVCIQRVWRGHRARLEAGRRRLELAMQREITAVEMLQKSVRTYLYRHRYLQTKAAVIQLQAYCRGYLLRRNLSSAATIIQRVFRGYLARKRVRKMTACVLRIQACVRGYQARKNHRKCVNAATTIQRAYRGHSAMKEQKCKFESIKKSCVTIQRCWRTYVINRERKITSAAITLQSAVRGYLVRRQYLNMCQKVIHLQAAIRGHAQRKQFTKYRNSVLLIQRRFRDYLVAKQQRNEYLRLREAVIFIQSRQRMIQQRRIFLNTRKSVVAVQSCVRMFIAKRKYNKLKQAAITLQQYYRARLTGQACRYSFLVCKGAAITIQANFRGHLVRKEMRQRMVAATCIQSHVMKFLHRKKYLSLRNAAVVCQNRFRSKLIGRQQQESYNKLRNAAAICQKTFRGQKSRKAYLNKREQIVKAQALVRMASARKSYLRLRNATVVCQQRYRAKKIGEICRRQFLVASGAAITIQAVLRGHIVRKELQKKNSAASVIQANCRGFIQRRRFVNLKSAAIVCQRMYSSKVIGVKQRYEYLAMKISAVKLQAAYRGYRGRKELGRKHHAATLIQSWCRRFIQKQAFTNLKSAAIVCQRRYRLKVIGNQQRHEFITMKNAALTLQSAFRGLQVRKEMCSRHRAATVIQALCRGFIHRRRFFNLKSAAIVCQRMYRSKVIGNQQRHEFITMKNAALTLQSAFRGLQVRKEMCSRHRAATVIQALCRGFIRRRRFINLKSSAIVCQRMYRSKVIGVKRRHEFLTLKTATVKLQSTFRGKQVRKELLRKHNAALLIQSVYRQFIQRQRFLNLKTVTVVCQRRYRAKVTGVNQRCQFVAMKNAAVILQAVFRGFSSRRKYLETRQKLIKLQSCIRGHQQRQKYEKQKYAAVVIQRRFRETLVARQQWSRFIMMKHAAILIQSVWKMVQMRKSYAAVRRDVIVAQSCVRRFLAQCRYRKLRSAVVTMQKLYRANVEGKVCRRQFLISKGAAMTIQAVFRGHLVRKDMRHKNLSATLIQSVVKCRLQRTKYLALKCATILCQRKYRAKVKGQILQRQYETMKKSVVTLQAAFRGRKCRKEYLKFKEAATKIQSQMRMRIARDRFKKMRNATLTIQRWYSGAVMTRQAEKDFLIKKGAAITIQASVKGFIVRKKFKQICAAQKIQSVYRMFVARRKYQHTKTRVISCQAAVRGYLVRKCRSELSRRQSAACVIQSKWRAAKLGQKQRSEFLKLKKATTVVQTLLRANLAMEKCRLEFLIRKGATITIQAALRGHLVRHKVKRDNEGAIKIQSCVRGYLCRKQFTTVRGAAVTCQRLYRANCYGRLEREKFIILKSAAVKIQSMYRMLKIRRSYTNCRNSSVTIQSWYRGMTERRRYFKCRWAAIVLQRVWRAELLCRKQAMEYHALRDAVIMLQSLFRGRVARNNYRKHLLAIKIQSFYRMMKERQHFSRVRNATLKIQTQIRAWKTKRGFQQLKEEKRKEREVYLTRVAIAMRSNLAAMAIQRCYRNYRVMSVAKEKLHSVVTIQRWMRSKLQRLHYLGDKQRVICVQSQIRTWLAWRDRAARVIQRAARTWLGTHDERKRSRASLKLQAYWRGYWVRKTCKSKKLATARHRVQAATAAATDDRRLGNRTTSALDYLLKYKHLSQVLDALMHLDVATRLSGVCCERLVEVNAVTVLYRLVRGCNRSLPHMEIIKYTVNIMLNLAKYEKTRPSLYEEEEGVPTLLELMQIYREKGPIFVKTCTLLGILALDHTCKMNILKDTKTTEKLKSIQKLTSRKHKLEETQRVTRAKMNATMNSTLSVRSPIKKHKIKPDWSLHKDKMRDIENPLKAINFILGNLGISTK